MSPIVVPKMILGVAVFVWLGLLGLLGTLTGLVVVHTVVAIPFVVAILAANLAGLNPSLEEAAMDLGATPLRALLNVTLPQVRPGLVVSAVFAFITSFDQVETSMFLVFLVGPTTKMLPIEMFLYMEKWQDPTIAALSALLLLLSALMMAVIQLAVPRLQLWLAPFPLLSVRPLHPTHDLPKLP